MHERIASRKEGSGAGRAVLAEPRGLLAGAALEPLGARTPPALGAAEEEARAVGAASSPAEAANRSASEARAQAQAAIESVRDAAAALETVRDAYATPFKTPGKRHMAKAAARAAREHAEHAPASPALRLGKENASSRVVGTPEKGERRGGAKTPARRAFETRGGRANRTMR
jgi:hypothetical protein